MRHLITMAIVTCLIFSAPAVAAKGNATEGKAQFAKKCAACHGAEGEGKEAIAKMFNVKMRPLGSKEVQAKNDTDLGKNVNDGVGKMKPVTGLSEQQVADVIAFVRTLAKK